jgi:trimeric autotransporter adhesin
MRIFCLIFIFCFLTGSFSAQIINTIAGTGLMGFSGDGGLATAATFSFPTSATADNFGNVYISDHYNNRIRKINASGIITTIAGTGAQGFSGDGGPALSAQLYFPMGLAIDGSGNIYIADYWNHRIRKINTSGIITTVAGNGVAGFSGDGGLATSAKLNSPSKIAVDFAGNLYIADTWNHRIRKVNASGIITTIVGTGPGFSGDGGPATLAKIEVPQGVAVDAMGNIYIGDTYNMRVRKIDPFGIITTIAGSSPFNGYGGDGGPAAAALLDNPNGVAVDASGNIYIADNQNHCIRRVNPMGVISTYAGLGGTASNGFSGDGGPGNLAQLNSPPDISVDAACNLYIADTNNGRIRKITIEPASCYVTTGINSQNYNQEILVFPNPSSGSLTISGKSAENVLITNQLGQEVERVELSEKNNFSGSVSGLESGIYFITGKNINQKAVVVRN